jgi:hypothetical protein
MEWQLSIDPDKFRSTNAMWNSLRLNSPWSVGYVTTLIESEIFASKEDWEKHYFQLGQARLDALSKLTPAQKQILTNELNQNDAISWDLKNLNLQYGRTKDDLIRKGEILYESVKNNRHHLTEDECYECVRYRVICETWNGVIVREKNTVQALLKLYPTLEFRKVSGKIDYQYAVDYEVFKNNELKIAIQIKPKSYLRDAPYIQNARRANKAKNQLYTKDFRVSVIDIISEANGDIINHDILKKLL